MSLSTCLMIMLGGAAGTLFRYLISVMTSADPHELPWSTIAVNIAGSLLIGFFGTLTLSSGRFPLSENVRLMVMVGLCGGFTTFSAFSLQTFDLLRAGSIVRATVNVVASVGLCVGAVAVGHAIASRVNGNAAAVAQISTEEGDFTPGTDQLS